MAKSFTLSLCSAYTESMNIADSVEKELKESGAEIISVGHSALGRDILCAHCGTAGKRIIVTAGIHARECYTALVVLRQIREFSGGGEAYFIPLVNPDGAVFFETGDAQGGKFLREHKAKHREWKANAMGVDLNCNFDANFGTGALNTFSPGAHGYVGEYPMSAPETKALAEFTLRVRPHATISYHCLGGELYWEFFQRGEERERDMKFASAIASEIGVKRVDGDLDSSGGYKDWCVQKLHIPAVTVELIESGAHPTAPSDFDADIQKNAHLPKFILEYLKGM